VVGQLLIRRLHFSLRFFFSLGGGIVRTVMNLRFFIRFLITTLVHAVFNFSPDTWSIFSKCLACFISSRLQLFLTFHHGNILGLFGQLRHVDQIRIHARRPSQRSGDPFRRDGEFVQQGTLHETALGRRRFAQGTFPFSRTKGVNDARPTKGVDTGQYDGVLIRRLTNGTGQGLAQIGQFGMRRFV